MIQKTPRTQAWLVRVFWLIVFFLCGVPRAFAHEKWFVSETTVGTIPAFFRTFAPGPAVFVLVMLGAVFLCFLASRHERRTALYLSRALASWLPPIVGIATGISVLFAALERTLFAPNLHLPDGALGTWIVLLQIAITFAFVFGIGTRIAAALTMLLSVLSVWWFGWDAFEYLNILGIAFFLFVWGRGRWSLGALFQKLFFSFDSSALRSLAVFFLHLSLGLTFCILGFEKLLRPDLHFATLALFPDHNPLLWYQSFLPFLTPNWYLLVSAMVEMCAGILIMLGIFLRPVSAVLLVPFLLYPLFFGVGEIPGHLPIIGTLLVFLLVGRQQISSRR
jgi:uncharacterized membrane protein YphA (DoxX/SURF4 family)